MFYPEPMKRIRFLVHESMKPRVVKRLHELGAVQMTDFREKLSKDEWSGLLEAHPVSADVRRVTTQLMAVNRLLDVFSMVAPEQEEGFFKTLFAPAAPEKIPVEDISGEKLFEEVSSTVSAVEDEVQAPLESLEKKGVEKSEIVLQQEFLERIKSLAVPLEALGDGPFVTAVMGIALKKDFSPLRSEIEKEIGGTFFFSEMAVSETETCLLVVCLVAEAEEVSACLRRWDVEKMPSGDYKGTPVEAIAEINTRISRLDEEQEKCRRTIRSSADRRRKSIKALRELLLIERERAEACSSFAKTEWVTAIEGWVIEKKIHGRDK
jgi:vacuolar-type H+-ATPase subunit I/STV1